MAERDEIEVAGRVVDWMKRRGWEVFKEVLDPEGRQICDVYGLNETQQWSTWAVEVKTSFSLRVIQQAVGWKKWSWMASVAVPRTDSRTRHFAMDVCARYGIGVIEVPDGEPPKEMLQPEASRPQARPELVPEQKDSVAGSSDGGHWTPFRRTCSKLIEQAEEYPGTPLSDAVAGIDHHYRHDESATTSLKRHFQDSKDALEGSYIWWDGGTPYLWPEGDGPHPYYGESGRSLEHKEVEEEHEDDDT